jgi:hypothetical protein
MKVYRPMKTDICHQKFGENIACVKVDSNGSPLKPTQVIVGSYPNSCPVGTKKFYTAVLGMKGHNGEDWGVYRGEPIYFCVQSSNPNQRWQVINEVDMDGGIGVNVYGLEPEEFPTLPIHEPGQFHMIEKQYVELGGRLYPMFKFWHCLSTVVPNYSFIQTGDLIAYGDSTGASAGDHTHWCLKIHNGTGFSIDSDNGYRGALDFRPYFENTFILDAVEPPKFRFTKGMKKGDVSTDVGLMQALLVRLGYMQPFKADETGIYGPKTATAVLAFQIGEKIPLSSYERYYLKGTVVGPKTLLALNIKLAL